MNVCKDVLKILGDCRKGKMIPEVFHDSLMKCVEITGLEQEKNKKNIVYKNGRGQVLITSKRKGIPFSTIISEDIFERKISGRSVCADSVLVSGREMLRPRVNKGKERGKDTSHLWQLYEPSAKGFPLQIDHISMRWTINTPPFLRLCTKTENERNKRCRTRTYRERQGFRFEFSHQFYEGEPRLFSDSFSHKYNCSFGDMCSKLGYKVSFNEEYDFLYINSPVYKNKYKMYGEIDFLERILLREFRYDPLVACLTSADELLLLMWVFFGILTTEQYYDEKVALLREQGDILAYYAISEENKARDIIRVNMYLRTGQVIQLSEGAIALMQHFGICLE